MYCGSELKLIEFKAINFCCEVKGTHLSLSNYSCYFEILSAQPSWVESAVTLSLVIYLQNRSIVFLLDNMRCIFYKIWDYFLSGILEGAEELPLQSCTILLFYLDGKSCQSTWRLIPLGKY